MFLALLEGCNRRNLCALCGKPHGPDGPAGQVVMTSPEHDPYELKFCKRCYLSASEAIGIAFGRLLFKRDGASS